MCEVIDMGRISGGRKAARKRRNNRRTFNKRLKKYGIQTKVVRKGKGKQKRKEGCG